MIEITSTRENLSNLFQYWVNLYNKKQFPDFEAIWQFIFIDGSERYLYYLIVSKGHVRYEEGEHNSPSITINTPVSVWLDITSGKLNATWGYLTRKYSIKGSLHYLKMLNKIFGKKFTNEDIIGVNDKIENFEITKKRKWKKPDRILIINGSPRMQNGYTYFYLQYLIKGIEKAGTKVEIVNIYDKEYSIEPCRGCFACWTSKNEKCVIEDEANEIIDKVKDAYLTIFVFPLYVDSIPAKLKAFIDRQFISTRPVFIPYHNLTRHPVKNKKESYMALFSVCGYPEIKHFNPLVDTFKGIARNFHRPLISSILRPCAESFTAPPYRIYLMNVLAAMEKAGEELVIHGKISKKVLNSISSNYGISKELWHDYANLHFALKRNGGNKDE
jgi:putative NADPH-quinone reductase/putative sterol carrier protein